MSDLKRGRRLNPLLSKAAVKSALSSSPTAYKVAATVYENSLYLPHVVRQGLTRTLIGMRDDRHGDKTRQRVMTWRVPFDPWNESADLIAWLRSRGIRVWVGTHIFYIPPQKAFRELARHMVAFYPDRCGFKVLKDCRHPNEAQYLYRHRHELRLLMRLIGRPRDQLVPANYMYSTGIGPRVWDLACWESKGARCSVFVVDHITGRGPTPRQYSSFLNRLKHLNQHSDLRVLIPHWEQNEDFLPPDCYGNLIYSDTLGRALYVDFQNFGLKDRFGVLDGRRSRNGTNDDAERRWTVVSRLFHDKGIDLHARLVLDVDCTTGLTIGASLASGAAWAVGWCDRNDMTGVEQSLLWSGATRFALVDRRKVPDDRLEVGMPNHMRDRLKDSVVFWRGHRFTDAFAGSLLRLPWAVLVCDGTAEPSTFYLRGRLPSSEFQVVTSRDPGLADPGITVIRRRHE